jgi:hypothetical protein
MVGLGIFTFILFWIAIIYDFKQSKKYGQGEFLEEWEKPYYIKENLFEHNGRTWERLHDHPAGEKLRVFSRDMLDYEYKKQLD